MNRSNLTVGIYMAAVFLSGVAVGGFGYRLYTAQTVTASERPGRPNPEEFRRRYVETLQNRLQLDAEQVGKLNTVLDQTRDRARAVREKYKPEFDAVHAKSRPEMRAVHEAQVAQIRALLKSDAQRQEYERFLAERDQKRRERDQREQNNQKFK
jgi:hypothetical protein